MICLSLEGAGYTVLSAAFAARCDRARPGASSCRPVSTCSSPTSSCRKMDAFELAGRDRAARLPSNVVVLYTSGYTDAAAEGPFIQKPFTPTRARREGPLRSRDGPSQRTPYTRLSARRGTARRSVTSHAVILIEVARTPDATVRELWQNARGLTERQAHRVLADLVEGGYLAPGARRAPESATGIERVAADAPSGRWQTHSVGELLAAARGSI